MASGARALPDLVARIRLDGSGVDQGIQALIGNFSKANIGIGVAAAGLGAIVGIAVEAERKYQALAESVHSYMMVTGESASVASAQVQAFRELGVSEDVAQQAMAKFSRAIETTPQKLAALGVEVARDAKGNVDLNASLFNVIDAWNATEDAAKRNEIALVAFGRNGVQAMLPILQAGSDALRKLEADVRVTMTDADIEQAHRYALKQKQVQSGWDAMWESIGQKLLPAQEALTDSYLRTEYVNRRMDDAEKTGILTANSSRGARLALSAAYGKEWDAAQTATLKLADLTDATNKAAAAAAAEAKAVDDAVNAQESAANSGIALERAELHQVESIGKVSAAQDNLNKVVKQYGPNSEEAQQATRDLLSALLDQKQAYIDAAGAAQKLAEDQAGPDATATDKAKAGHDAYIAKLQEEANSLAPGSPLRDYLEQYIARLNAIPAAVQTTVSLHGSAFGGSGGNQLASGGPAVPGRTYTVGEEGPETLIMGSNGGYVIPNAGGSRASGSAPDMSQTNDLLRLVIRAVYDVAGSGASLTDFANASAAANYQQARGMAGA